LDFNLAVYEEETVSDMFVCEVSHIKIFWTAVAAGIGQEAG